MALAAVKDVQFGMAREYVWHLCLRSLQNLRYFQLLFSVYQVVILCVYPYMASQIPRFHCGQSTVQFKCPLLYTVFPPRQKTCKFNGIVLLWLSIKKKVLHYSYFFLFLFIQTTYLEQCMLHVTCVMNIAARALFLVTYWIYW